MMRYWKEHPLFGGALVAVAIMLGVALAVFALRRTDHEPHAVAPAATESHAGSAAADPHAGHAGHGSELPGYSAFGFDAEQAKAMGLTTEAVAERDFTRTIRTVGIVTVDETRTAHVHTRVRGWIEQFHAQFVGRKVRAGEPLVSIYSQEVYAAEMELASLLKSPVHSDELLAAARSRLALWDVPKSVIAKVEQTGEPQRTFPILAPRSGVIVAKQAFEGLFVDPSIELYTISDLSKIWVLADIYDTDLAEVSVGAPARLTIEGQTAAIVAKVAFMAPTIDERTRTRKVRFELDSQKGRLMPGAFVNVELDATLERGLAVPDSAVIRTGERAIVFVVHGGVHAVPREVKLGPHVDNYYRVDSGLTAGEEVATGAQFLLDSESRLRATSGAGGGHNHGGAHAGH